VQQLKEVLAGVAFLANGLPTLKQIRPGDLLGAG